MGTSFHFKCKTDNREPINEELRLAGSQLSFVRFSFPEGRCHQRRDRDRLAVLD